MRTPVLVLTLGIATAAFAGSAAAAVNEKACLDWLAKYAQSGRVDAPEIGYGKDPKIGFDKDGELTADLSACSIERGIAAAGGLTCSEVHRTAVRPELGTQAAYDYFKVRVCRDSSGKLVRAEMQAPEHMRGDAPTVWEDYSVEFETVDGVCRVNHAYGHSAFNPIDVGGGVMKHVVADRTACQAWQDYWRANPKLDRTKEIKKDGATAKWVLGWAKKSAKWMDYVDDATMLAEFANDQCDLIAEFTPPAKPLVTKSRTGGVPAGTVKRSSGGG